MIREALINRCKKKGFVTAEEILGLFPNQKNTHTDFYSRCVTLHESGKKVSAEWIKEVIAKVRPETDKKRGSGRPPKSEKSPDILYLLFLNEIQRIPQLKPKTEMELAKRIREGARAAKRLQEDPLDDQDRKRFREEVREAENAKRRLVKASLRLVASLARRYGHREVSSADLFQEGSIGLMIAAQKYDGRLGNRFSTYAYYWIYRRITRCAWDQANVIRLPHHLRERKKLIEQAIENLELRLKREPIALEIAESCGLSEKVVVRFFNTMPRVYSLDSLLRCPYFPLVWDGDDRFVQLDPCPACEVADQNWQSATDDDDFELPPCLLEQLGSSEGNSLYDVDYSLLGTPSDLFENCWSAMLQDTMRDALDSLTERECKVLRMRFGLDDGQPRTMADVGQALSVTWERVRQIETKALRKLRHPRSSKKLKDFLS